MPARQHCNDLISRYHGQDETWQSQSILANDNEPTHLHTHTYTHAHAWGKAEMS